MIVTTGGRRASVSVFLATATSGWPRGSSDSWKPTFSTSYSNSAATSAGRVHVEHLGDLGHHAEIHQLPDDDRRLDAELVGELADRDDVVDLDLALLGLRCRRR
jgi:hypothetical protein